jgi:hypothetical protein
MTIDAKELIKKLSDPGNVSKPWMTARLLARKVGLAESSAHEVEESLLNYYKKILGTSQVPEIRYSSLPAKGTLEVLWGHTKFVGNRQVYELKKTNVADDSLDVDQDITTADIFISHSFKDYNDVIQIGKML